jgi:hypothetical protein
MSKEFLELPPGQLGEGELSTLPLLAMEGAMKTAFAAIVAASLFGLSQQAAAETLIDILFPKAKPDIAATSRPKLDHAATGSVVKAKNHVPPPADQKSSYPQPILWSLPYP